MKRKNTTEKCFLRKTKCGGFNQQYYIVFTVTILSVSAAVTNKYLCIVNEDNQIYLTNKHACLQFCQQDRLTEFYM